jgi:hypothetical protein
MKKGTENSNRILDTEAGYPVLRSISRLGSDGEVQSLDTSSTVEVVMASHLKGINMEGASEAGWFGYSLQALFQVIISSWEFFCCVTQSKSLSHKTLLALLTSEWLCLCTIYLHDISVWVSVLMRVWNVYGIWHGRWQCLQFSWQMEYIGCYWSPCFQRVTLVVL